MRKSISKKMPEFGISPIELGFYRFIKSNLIKTAVLSGVEVSVLPGGVEAIEKGLDYPNASAILIRMRKKGLLNYYYLNTKEGKSLIIELKEIA